VTPAREPVPQFDEIKTSSVRFMKGIVNNFNDQQLMIDNKNLALPQHLADVPSTQRNNNQQKISSFSPFRYTTESNQRNNLANRIAQHATGFGMNFTDKNIPVSIVKKENLGDVTTTIERC